MCLCVFASQTISEFTDPNIPRCRCAGDQDLSTTSRIASMTMSGGVEYPTSSVVLSATWIICYAGDARSELVIGLAERLEHRVLKFCRVVGGEGVADPGRLPGQSRRGGAEIDLFDAGVRIVPSLWSPGYLIRLLDGLLLIFLPVLGAECGPHLWSHDVDRRPDPVTCSG